MKNTDFSYETQVIFQTIFHSFMDLFKTTTINEKYRFYIQCSKYLSNEKNSKEPFSKYTYMKSLNLNVDTYFNLHSQVNVDISSAWKSRV